MCCLLRKTKEDHGLCTQNTALGQLPAPALVAGTSFTLQLLPLNTHLSGVADPCYRELQYTLSRASAASL